MKAHFLLIASLVCCGGGSGGGSGSDDPEDTICEKAASCLGLTDTETDECRTVAGESPAGVLAECAECVADHSCSEISGDACSAECAGVNFDPEATREENATAICDKADLCGENPPPTCVDDVVNSSVSDDVIASCADCAETTSCTDLTNGACEAECS